VEVQPRGQRGRARAGTTLSKNRDREKNAAMADEGDRVGVTPTSMWSYRVNMRAATSPAAIFGCMRRKRIRSLSRDSPGAAPNASGHQFRRCAWRTTVKRTPYSPRLPACVGNGGEHRNQHNSAKSEAGGARLTMNSWSGHPSAPCSDRKISTWPRGLGPNTSRGSPPRAQGPSRKNR